MEHQQLGASPREEASNAVSASKQWRKKVATYRRRDKPVNVADVEDLAVCTGNQGVGAHEFDLDGGIS